MTILKMNLPFSVSEYFILPDDYIHNPNLYRFGATFHTVNDVEEIITYIDDDFERNFKVHLLENGIREGNDEMGEMLDFQLEYPYCYFFIETENSELCFSDKSIFRMELINLFDIPDNLKQEIFLNYQEEWMLVKLEKRLRNQKQFPIPDNTELGIISDNIDFVKMYNENLIY